jgi:hypothetical protein
MTTRWTIALSLLLGAGLAAAAETGYVLRITDLKSRPFLDSETLVKLPEKTPVEILARQGPWMRVKAHGNQGYVRMLQVRLNLSDTVVLARAPGSAVRPPTTSRSAGTSPIITTGVRGFDEQGLKDAQPDPAAFERMVSYAIAADQAQQFAQRGELGARSVPYYTEDGKKMKEARR